MIATAPGRLVTSHDARLDHEAALRQQGYVPMIAYDALYPRFDSLLPACRVQELVTDVDHGRIVWSHPGRSGVDPRAIAPLAIVRVADGLGPDPLDPPIDLAAAARELLDGDVQEWVTRRRHRVLAQSGDVACVCEVDDDARGCVTHPVADPLLQRAADALGDATYAHCWARVWRNPSCTQWGMPTDKPHDPTGLVRCALEASLRLGGWLRRGVSGPTAWDLTRYGVTLKELECWRAAGFSVDDVPRWWDMGRPGPLARRRDNGESPDRPIRLPSAAAGDGKRGITGFVAWKMSCHTPDRYFALVPCSLCRAKDTETPCRTCRAEGRTVPLEHEWTEHVELARLGPAYAPGVAGTSVVCGDRNCRTSVATSAAAIEGTQQ